MERDIPSRVLSVSRNVTSTEKPTGPAPTTVPQQLGENHPDLAAGLSTWVLGEHRVREGVLGHNCFNF